MKYFFVSKNAHARVVKYLEAIGQVVLVHDYKGIDGAISAHPDLQILNIKGQLLVAPFIDAKLMAFIKDKGLAYKTGKTIPKGPYPRHIPYNAVVLDRYFIHNMSYTDPAVVLAVEQLGLIPIPVKQGYTKCSTVVVDGRSIITADKGITKAVSKYDIDCLLVKEGFVELPTYPHGFLGGASGKCGDALVWNGSLQRHPSAEQIRDFLKSKAIESVEFDGLPLVDIGSILQWEAN